MPQGVEGFTISKHLRTRLTTGRCSSGLIAELEHRLVNRITNIFMITDEIAALDGASPARGTRTKPAAMFRRRLLKGLWHKHHLHSSLDATAKNVANQWARAPETFEVPAGLTPEELWKVAGEISHRIVLDGYQNRSNAGELTGEWLVYAKQDGVNYYLTLGTHTEGDEAVWTRCRACVGEFPDLQILQENRLRLGESQPQG